VHVPDHNKLEKGKDFNTGAKSILLSSRIMVAWLCAGVAAGAFEAAHKYALERK